MKKNQSYFYAFLTISLLTLLLSCNERDSEDNIYKQLEEKAKINTFPLTIVVAEELSGTVFPTDIQTLSAFSKQQCKTLPIAGIYRLGIDLFYTYNSISELKIPSSIAKDEVTVISLVEQQVADYLSKKQLKDYDSLLTPNQPDWDVKALFLNHINKTSPDSNFFFSNTPNTPSVITVGNRTYNVYNNSNELRKKIDELICKGQVAVKVYYNPPSLDTSGGKISKINWPEKGALAGDTCMGYAKYEKLHDGKGGFKVGNFIDSNSVSCGYVFPTGLAGDTCITSSKYQKLHDGKGGFRIGNLIEHKSKDCGYVFPLKGTPTGEFITDKESKYEKVHDGKGGFMRGKLVEAKPVEPVKKVEIKPVKPKTSEPVKPKSKEPRVIRSDNRCSRKSEPLCEQDNGGNYTGRRVQYCYNRSGRIIQTIVLAKCDSECRCL